MKKIIVTIAAVFAFGFVNAQEVKFGVKLGLNNPKISGDFAELGQTTKIGFNLGGFAEIGISDKLFIQPELLFSTQGTNIKESEFLEKTKWNLNYLNIPLMAKYYVVDKLSIEAGPQFGFLLSAKVKYTDSEYDESVSLDVKEGFKSIDFGFNIGGGYDFTDNFSLGLRYNFGLSNIVKSELGEGADAKNSVLALSAMYKF